jgi:hypothetical protein
MTPTVEPRRASEPMAPINLGTPAKDPVGLDPPRLKWRCQWHSSKPYPVGDTGRRCSAFRWRPRGRGATCRRAKRSRGHRGRFRRLKLATSYRVGSTAGCRRGEATDWPLARLCAERDPGRRGAYARRVQGAGHTGRRSGGCGTSPGDYVNREAVCCERESGCWKPSLSGLRSPTHGDEWIAGRAARDCYWGFEPGGGR